MPTTFRRKIDDAAFEAAVERDLHGCASKAEIAMLEDSDNLVYWLQTLAALLRKSEAHTARDKARLDEVKPPLDTHPTREYVEARRQFREREARRTGFRNVVKARRAQVVLLLGKRGLTPVTLGRCLDLLVEVEGLLEDGNIEAAQRTLTAAIDSWERQAVRGETA
jgi:hypothetical protein